MKYKHQRRNLSILNNDLYSRITSLKSTLNAYDKCLKNTKPSKRIYYADKDKYIAKVQEIFTSGRYRVKFRKSFDYNLHSQNLKQSLERIESIDVERAGDVYSFYVDLDKSIESVANKTHSGGYQFWVVGNRTVKNELLQTDVIITELATQYNLVPVHIVDRNIPNKVMPSLNSPSNVSGAKGSTMTMEHIVILRKE